MALVVRTKSITKQSTRDSNDIETSIVDSSWEAVDPNPDIHSLFVLFNDKFFNGALAGCEVRWSPRMTYCAGLCVYEGRGGLCSVRLSEPLLKFRPRKDVVETLLHEMIHAYLFVTARDRDRESHGPQFQAHMNRINAATGANITIYHNYNAEVDYHRRHWWRCLGPCRDRPPYFGYVKRSMNRPPGPNDTWYSQHQRSCGGVFEKIKEPEKIFKKGAATNCTDETSGSTKRKKNTDDRFLGEGRVVGEGASGKMRRLDEYFDSVGKNEKKTSTKMDGDSSRVPCPVCENFIESSNMNCHLDECLTRAMLNTENGGDV